jgi:hypothetical protein
LVLVVVFKLLETLVVHLDILQMVVVEVLELMVAHLEMDMVAEMVLFVLGVVLLAEVVVEPLEAEEVLLVVLLTEAEAEVLTGSLLALSTHMVDVA